MPSYLGPLGGLVQVKASRATGIGSERAGAEFDTTSGVTRMQVSPRSKRRWSLDLGLSTPAQIAGLAALAAGEFGIGPFWFVEPWAQVTNLIGPHASMAEFDAVTGLTFGGPINTVDGRAGRHVIVDDPAALIAAPRFGAGIQWVPCLPLQPVTHSIYATGAGVVEIGPMWQDASGVVTTGAWTTYMPGTTVAQRIHTTTLQAPVSAVATAMRVRGAARLARPAITWTSAPMDWHVGQGAPSVAIPATLGQDIITAHREANGRMATVTTTIREVG